MNVPVVEDAIVRSSGAGTETFPDVAAFLSFQWVYWWSSNFGFSIEADMGTALPAVPVVQLTFGLAFGMQPFKTPPPLPLAE